jgi:uncharacterized membrane protein
MANNVTLDALIGGLITGGFSYMTSRYYESINYVKIIAFIYAAPCLYFYMLYVLSKDSKTAMNDFTIHALLGTISTIILMILTLLFRNRERNELILGNLVGLIIILCLYFYYEIYKLI